MANDEVGKPQPECRLMSGVVVSGVRVGVRSEIVGVVGVRGKG